MWVYQAFLSAMAQGKSTDKETKALILAEAKMLGKQEAAKRNGVAPRTIYNWEQQLATDDELAEFFRQKQNYLQFRWVEKLPGLVETISETLQKHIRETEPDAKSIEVLTNTLQLVTKMQFALFNNEQLRNLGINTHSSDQ
jgi:hypothetical protein